MNKRSFLLPCFLLALTGSYNAVVINSQSEIDSREVKFAKRLDEVTGVVIPGKTIALTGTGWKKLKASKKRQNPKPEVAIENPPVAKDTMAAIQEDLQLQLVEVINPKKWHQGLLPQDFSGDLITSNGTIESLTIALPKGEGLAVNFSEMSGNVFEYELEGETFKGMMYQVDQSTYMVTLTNGSLEGTRLKFSQEPVIDESTSFSETLAQNELDLGAVSFQF